MSVNKRVDVLGAFAVAVTAAQFDWTWTRGDTKRFATQVGWNVPERRAWSLRSRPGLGDTNTDVSFVVEDRVLKSVLLKVADTAEGLDRTAIRLAYRQLYEVFRDRWAEPSGYSRGTVRDVWTLPTVSVGLQFDGSSVFVRLDRPDPDEIERARSRRAQAARCTDSSRFIATIPLLVRAELGDWSRTPMTRAVTATTWPIRTDSVLRENITAAYESDFESLYLSASATPDHADADRWGFGEFDGLTLCQFLTPDALDAAYATALSECVRLLGAPPRVGGPGAKSMWEIDGSRITLSRDLSAGSDTAGLYLSVIDAYPHDGLVEWEWENSEDDEWPLEDAPDDYWYLFPNSLDESPTVSKYPGFDQTEPRARSWVQLDDYLHPLFESLTADLPLLHPYASTAEWTIGYRNDPQGWITRGQFTHTGSRLEVHGPGDTIEATEFPPGPESGIHIAMKVNEVLRASGAENPEKLWCEYRSSAAHQDLPSFRTGLDGKPDAPSTKP
ncbi:DUF6301 family protein [Nocardia sp. NPDC051981]|uniref:DUF6301 family protein n=1 Tax=Nocardia sp. NPDC051981 TaxID=3155417 RepID=UPI00343CD943